jgi:hypothetical protein
VKQYARSSSLVHERKDDSLDDFSHNPGRAAYMKGHSLDWPTTLEEVIHSRLQSFIDVPYRKAFIETNRSSAASDIRVLLCHNFDCMPYSAELQHEK